MNKQLILDNKECFDHWLAGGSILAKYVGKYPDSNGWCNIIDIWTTTDKYIVVINDKYVEYRCALAEGKPLQVLDKHCSKGNNGTWFYTSSISNTIPVSSYRVKPDEPTLKVGDFVRFTDTPNQVEQYDGKPYHKEVRVELWKPQPGELCYFYSEDPTYFIVAKFDKIEYNTTLRTSMYKNSTGSLTVNIAPFTNQLPICLKE